MGWAMGDLMFVWFAFVQSRDFGLLFGGFWNAEGKVLGWNYVFVT